MGLSVQKKNTVLTRVGVVFRFKTFGQGGSVNDFGDLIFIVVGISQIVNCAKFTRHLITCPYATFFGLSFS
jgi:hypothetical protein